MARQVESSVDASRNSPGGDFNDVSAIFSMFVGNLTSASVHAGG